MVPPFFVFRITGQQRLRCGHKIIDEFVKIVLAGGVVCRLKSYCFAEQVTSEWGVPWKSELFGNGHECSVKTKFGKSQQVASEFCLGSASNFVDQHDSGLLREAVIRYSRSAAAGG